MLYYIMSRLGGSRPRRRGLEAVAVQREDEVYRLPEVEVPPREHRLGDCFRGDDGGTG